MKTQLLFLRLLGLLSLVITSVEPKPSHTKNKLQNSSPAGVAASFKRGLAPFPEMDDLSEKEMIAIIKDSFQGNFQSNYVGEQNWNLRANQTGHFNNTDGSNGNWKSNSSMHFFFETGKTSLASISVRSMWIDGKYNQISVTRNKVLYTQLSKDVVVAASLAVSYTFNEAKGSYSLVSNSVIFGQNIVENGTMFVNEGMTITNNTNHFSITSSSSDGDIMPDGKFNIILGSITTYTLSLNGKQVSGDLPNDPKILVHLLETLVTPSPNFASLTRGTFSGRYTMGKSGTYNSGSHIAIQDTQGLNILSKSKMSGSYWTPDQSELGQLKNVNHLIQLFASW